MAKKRRKRTGSKKAAAQLVLLEDTLTPGVEGLKPFFKEAISTTFRYYESRVENYARVNAPWTDQTSNARNGLIARSGSTKDSHFIVLAHRVPYGIWLEVRWGGKYATIMPTIDAMAPEVMGTLNKILGRYGGRAI